MRRHVRHRWQLRRRLPVRRGNARWCRAASRSRRKYGFGPVSQGAAPQASPLRLLHACQAAERVDGAFPGTSSHKSRTPGMLCLRTPAGGIRESIQSCPFRTGCACVPCLRDPGRRARRLESLPLQSRQLTRRRCSQALPTPIRSSSAGWQDTRRHPTSRSGSTTAATTAFRSGAGASRTGAR